MSKKNSLLIDVYKANNPYSGLGQFSMQFAKHLVEASPKQYNINFLGKPERFLNQPSAAVSANLVKRIFPNSNKHYDIWHSLYQLPSYLPPYSSRWVLTIHDLNFMQEKSPQKAKKYLKRLQNYVNRASVITTISAYSKSQIQKHLDVDGKEVKVVHNGVEINTEKQSEPSKLPNGPYFCSIGIFNAKKNFKVLLPLMKQFPEHQLVLIGNHQTSYGKEVKDEIKALKLEKQVLLTGEVSDAEKNWYYAHMDCLLFPSLAEGFGIPPIEAMHFGKPVVINKATSLPEIGGDLAGYFISFSEESMAKAINDTLQNSKDQSFSNQLKQHAAQFTWEKSIQEYIKIYNELV